MPSVILTLEHIKDAIDRCLTIDELNALPIMDSVVAHYLTNYGGIGWQTDETIYQLQAYAQYHAFRLQMYTGADKEEFERHIMEKRDQ